MISLLRLISEIKQISTKIEIKGEYLFIPKNNYDYRFPVFNHNDNNSQYYHVGTAGFPNILINYLDNLQIPYIKEEHYFKIHKNFFK